MNTRKRIVKYIDTKGISKYRFYKDVGVSNGYLDKEGNVGSDICEKISYQYVDLNIEWLITGRGEMLKGSTTSANLDTIVNEPSIDLVSYMKEQIRDKDAEIVRLSNENALLKSDLEKYESKKNASTKDNKRSTQAPIEPKLK